MYKIEKIPFGFKMSFGGFITEDEMNNWVNDSKKALLLKPLNFGVYVDMRTLKPLPPESQKIMQGGQKLYKMAGMKRSVVILNDAVTTMQFKRIAKETGIYQWERYINAKEKSNFELLAVNWLTKGEDPDK